MSMLCFPPIFFQLTSNGHYISLPEGFLQNPEACFASNRLEVQELGAALHDDCQKLVYKYPSSFISQMGQF